MLFSFAVILNVSSIILIIKITKIKISVVDGKLIAWVHQNAEVLEEKAKADFMHFTIKIDEINLAKLQNKLAQ